MDIHSESATSIVHAYIPQLSNANLHIFWKFYPVRPAGINQDIFQEEQVEEIPE